LKRERIGRNDNFFALGGHSLLASQLIYRINEVFALALPLRSLFQEPALADLALAIEEGWLAGITAHDEAELLGLHTSWPATPADPLLLHSVPDALDTMFMAAATPEADPARVQRRAELAARQAQLPPAQPAQVIAPSVPLTLALLDLRDVPPEQHESAARQFAASVQHPFALDQAPLLRVGLVRLADTEHLVIVTLHHLIADGWSLNVFIHDLTQLYSAAIAGRAATLTPLPVQYGDYALWQREWLQGQVLEAQLAYWKQQLAGAPALLTLPYDHARPPQPSFAGETYRLEIPVAVQQALRQLSRELRGTLFMMLLAAWQGLLGRLSGQEDIVVGVPVAGRGRAEL